LGSLNDAQGGDNGFGQGDARGLVLAVVTAIEKLRAAAWTMKDTVRLEEKRAAFGRAAQAATAPGEPADRRMRNAWPPAAPMPGARCFV
jgi:hypothetical protein